jgi:hypothetical protein
MVGLRKTVMKNNGIQHNLYWTDNIVKWGCNDCNEKGDRFNRPGVCKGK